MGWFDKIFGTKIISPVPEPTPTPKYDYSAYWGPTATPTPPPPPPKPQLPPRSFDYESVANFPPNVAIPPQPSKEIGDILWKYFPTEATQSAIASKYESHWNPQATSPVSPGGTIDRGLFQVSTKGTQPGTYEDLMNRKSGLMKNAGVTNVNDLYSPEKNSKVMNLIRDEERYNGQIPFKRTYGWQNQGITWK